MFIFLIEIKGGIVLKEAKSTPSPSWHTALPSYLIKTNRDSCKKAIAHQAIAFFIVLKIPFPPFRHSERRETSYVR